MSKRDDIKILYDKALSLSKVIKSLFYLNVVISFLSLINCDLLNQICITFQICISILFVFLSILDDYLLWNAEKSRRKDNVQIAFGMKLQQESTEEYYSNDLSPSLSKHVINTFESNLYSMEVSRKMLTYELFKMVLSIVAFVIALIHFKNGQFLLIISQTLFSTYFILSTMQLFPYYLQMSHLYKEAYNNIISIGKVTDAWMQSYVIEYECVKAYFKIRLNSNIFNKHHDEFDDKWKKIYKEIRITVR